MPDVKEKKHLLESLGCGAAFLDYDNDGDPDLYLVDVTILADVGNGTTGEWGAVVATKTTTVG